MTPSERLKKALPDDVLIHEIGHVIIGFELGLAEGGIQFSENNPHEIACAHFNRIGATALQIVTRGLAGMYCQALCRPNSIVEPLRIKILKEELFVSEACLTNKPPDVAAIISHGFVGDWIRIIDAAKSEGRTSEQALVLLQKGHKELVAIAKAIKLDDLADIMLQDVKNWMDIDDADLDLSPDIFYSVGRARPVWQSAKDQV